MLRTEVVNFDVNKIDGQNLRCGGRYNHSFSMYSPISLLIANLSFETVNIDK